MSIQVDFKDLDEAMTRFEWLLPANQYRLTLVCRYVGTEALDADIVLTRDDLTQIAAVIEKRAAIAPRFKSGDLIP